MMRRTIALLLCMALLLGLTGCGAKQDFFSEEDAAVTEATEPAATVPADGDPNNVTCKGSYTASDADVSAAKDTVVATVGDAKLTNGLLQFYYWLEVAAYRISTHPFQPDFGRPLDTQSCVGDSGVNSWQQYFLRNALSAWHAQQALVQMGEEEGVPTEAEYKPDLEKRTEYLTGMPASEYLYAWSDGYKPNRLHQDYLDAIPETLTALSADSGFGDKDLSAMAAAIAGTGADSAGLVEYTTLLNRAYMYFTEMGYHFEPTAEEVEAYYQETMSADKGNDGHSVDIRHILLLPENAQIAADGTVTASEDDWDRCRVRAQSVVDNWKNEISKTRYSQFTTASIPEARFSEIAKDHSQDPGSRANGGLYVALTPGQLMPELDAWCFDEARQHGDYEIIRTNAGYHIVFFSARNEDWFTDAQARLTETLYNELVQEAMEKYPITTDYSAICLGEAEDNGSFVTASDLLYPDVAHERFPDMPLYLQQDYPDAPFGNYKLSTHGCGITTLAMVASYLADDELTPVELAARYGYYCGQRGSEIVLFDDTPAEMGFHLQNRSYSWAEIDEALKNGQVVVSLQWFGYWTRGGHYLAMIGMTEDDRYVVRDSNLINYKRILNHVEDSHSRGSISEAGQYYWIYEPKVTSIGACTRCGGGMDGAPEVMFRTDYTCEKCLTATGRRGDFLNSFAG